MSTRTENLDTIAEAMWCARNEGKVFRPYHQLSDANREVLRKQAESALDVALDVVEEMDEDERRAVGVVPTNCNYPEVTVKLVGEDGNAYSIMHRVSTALLEHGVSKEEVDQYFDESKSGDYNNLLRVAMTWVNVY